MKFNTHLITHSGVFHADEVTAIALIAIAEGRGLENYHITRTREKLDKLQGIFIDVGGVYAPEDNKFDHHQIANGKLSSAGMVWREISKLPRFKNAPSIAKLVKEVDEQDLGMVKHDRFHYCNLIGSYNTKDLYDDYQDAMFNVAVKFAMQILLNLLRSDANAAEEVIVANETPVMEVEGVEIAIIPKNKYASTYHFVGKVDMLVSWDSGQNCWTIMTVPIVKGSFDTVFKIADCDEKIFVHTAGFIAKCQPNMEGNLSFKLQSRNGTYTNILIPIKGE